MTPKPQALAALKDIHLPTAIGWWPLAPGWYVVALVSIAVLVFSMLWCRKKYIHGRAKRAALRLLLTYQQAYNDTGNTQLTCMQISALLKRVALAYFPREQVASLQGESWLDFLTHTAKGVDFKQVQQELLEFPYDATAQSHNMQLLFKLVRMWIRSKKAKHNSL